MRTPVLALLLCGVLTASALRPAAAQGTAPAGGPVQAQPWGQCGGGDGCPSTWSCGDQAWSDVMACPQGFECKRLSSFFWQCMPPGAALPQVDFEEQQRKQRGAAQGQAPAPANAKAPADAALVAPFAQCGGTACPPGAADCGMVRDGAWAQCPIGFSCNRQSAFFWSCRPGGDARSDEERRVVQVKAAAAAAAAAEVQRAAQREREQAAALEAARAAAAAAAAAEVAKAAQAEQERQTALEQVKAAAAAAAAAEVAKGQAELAKEPERRQQQLQEQREREQRERDAKARRAGAPPPAAGANATAPKQPGSAPAEGTPADAPAAPPGGTAPGEAANQTAAQPQQDAAAAAAAAPADASNATDAAGAANGTAAAPTAGADAEQPRAVPGANQTEGAAEQGPRVSREFTAAAEEAKARGAADDAARAEQQPQPDATQQPAGNATAEAPPAASPPVKMNLEWPGVTAEQYQRELGPGTLSALSEVSGVPADSITTQLPGPAAGGRKLLQGASLNVAYELATTDFAATTAKMNQALSNNGDGFFNALAKNGVNIKPGVALNGAAMVPVGGAPQPSGGLANWQKVVIGVCVGVGGFLLLLGVGLCCFLRRRRASKAALGADKAAAGAAARHGVHPAPPDAAAASDLVDQRPHGGAKDKGAAARDSSDAAQRPDQTRDAGYMTASATAKPSSFNSAAAAGAAAAALPVAAGAGAASKGGPGSSSSAGGSRKRSGVRLGPGGSTASWGEGDDASDTPASKSGDARAPWKPPGPSGPIPPLAPAEHHPRSYNPDAAGRPPALAVGAAAAAGAMGAGAAAGAAAAGAHRRGHSNASGDLPQTPTSVPDAGEFHDAREAAGSSSGASFYSAGGGDGGSEASYASARSAGLSDAGSAASFRTAGSRATNVSSSSKLSASASAKSFPRAYVPKPGSDTAESDDSGGKP